MKNKISIIALAIASFLTVGCDRFEEINTSQTNATIGQVKPEYFLNASILGAQMNPDTAERSFILYWQGGGHQASAWTTGLQDGYVDDGWTSNYWNGVVGWVKSATLAINVAKEKKANGTADVANDNVMQVARIWRAYVMSEMADNFGSLPIDAFQGVNPKFNSQKEVYYFMLDELKDAVSKIDAKVSNAEVAAQDPAYGYNWNKWIKYANSMRMRLAMRIAEVDPAKAKTEFEAAVATGNFIDATADNFKVQEHPANTWDDLTAVMSRPWNSQWISPTINNLYLGLGGVTSESMLAADLKPYIKSENYIGQSFPQQFTKMTNDPSAGYWLDGLPYSIDPRAYKTYYIPGNTSDPAFADIHKTRSTKGTLTFEDKSTKAMDAKYTWNAVVGGDWGGKENLNGLIGTGKFPAVANQFRGPAYTTYRIFFASWESYFLIAEANLKGWSTPMDDETAYNKGIQDSFTYMGVSQYYASYIASEAYNRAGTSVKYSHTAEPGDSHTMNYVDGKTGAVGTVNIKYPVNTIYKGGAVRNDKLTKIITQKFIANTPWLPLETWNDHRRLGLPFFENQAVENPIPTIPALTTGNYMTNSAKVFPQRLQYPSSFRNNDPEHYAQAVSLLGGADDVFTPLWWAKK